MTLFQLLYASVARPGMDYDQLTDILRPAVDRNAERGLTGLLCYGGSIFLRALEGKHVAVNRLYDSIVRDPRHGDCRILDASVITARDFAEWSMKLIGFDDAPKASAAGVSRTGESIRVLAAVKSP